MTPLLAALRSGETLSIEALDRRVMKAMKLSTEALAVPHSDDDSRSEVEYRLAWARTYLKNLGLVENLSRGQWRATARGRAVERVDAETLIGNAVPADEEDAGDKLPPQLVKALSNTWVKLTAEREFLSLEKVRNILAGFRERFGPEALAKLDGRALLTLMHERPSRDSLVYWLEFKDDEEFPKAVGSIAGGSAYKFGFYRSESGVWMGGTAQQPRVLSEEEALEKARQQRNQFVAGDRVLREHAAQGTPDYARLAASLATAAPDVCRTAWGHKYFALLHPELLDQNHTLDYQRFQAIKLLRVPGEDIYENARLFLDAAHQIGISLFDLSVVLHRQNGTHHQYWRVGTTDDGASEWPRMLAGGFMSVGWSALGDLSAITADAEARETLRAKVAQAYPDKSGPTTRSANQLFSFLNKAAPGDVVVAMDGATVKGVGRIRGTYVYQAEDGPFPHRKSVEWASDAEWRLPTDEGLRTTFTKLGKHAKNLVAIERHLLVHPVQPPRAAPTTSTSLRAAPPPALTGIEARIEGVLQRKGQVILHGPPGTGKSYYAEKAIEELAARSWFNQAADDANRQELRKKGAIEVCTFHPAYGYEDFLEGFRPALASGKVAFDLKDGLFKRLCDRAHKAPTYKHFLLIDEINRGDVPRIFGELLTVLERDKRGRSITLPLSGKPFSVPPNVFVVGTMNTADRSIALLDAALRRRFGFIEMVPRGSVLGSTSVEGLPLGPWLDKLNERIVEALGRDGRSLQIGHSYLMPSGAPVREAAQFVEIFRDELLPLLEEYCYEDAEALQRILGDSLVRVGRPFNDELFEPERHRDLIQALLRAFPGISTSREAMEADADADATADDAEEDTEGDG